MDAQQELFTKIKLELEAKGYAVFDGFLPPENTPYPFIYLADNQDASRANKGAICGNVYQTIHVWSDTPKNRGTVSAMLLTIKDVCKRIEETDNFGWMLGSVNQRILADNTTKQPLLHGIIEAEFKYS